MLKSIADFCTKRGWVKDKQNLWHKDGRVAYFSYHKRNRMYVGHDKIIIEKRQMEELINNFVNYGIEVWYLNYYIESGHLGINRINKQLFESIIWENRLLPDRSFNGNSRNEDVQKVWKEVYFMEPKNVVQLNQPKAWKDRIEQLKYEEEEFEKQKAYNLSINTENDSFDKNFE